MDVKDYDRALKAYRAEWERTHQRPERRRPHMMDFAQFLMFLPIAAIGPLVSGFRTAALISAHTAFQEPWTIWVETALATLLFEWGVIAFQVQRLRREMGSKKKLPEIGTEWIWVGVVTTIGAVAVSNTVEIGVDALKRAGHTVPPIVPALAIGIFLGLGVIIISAISGEVVGRFILEYQVEDRKLRARHAKEVQEWEEQFVRSWDRVKGKRLAAIGRTVAAGDRKRKPAAVVGRATAPGSGEAVAGGNVQDRDSGRAEPAATVQPTAVDSQGVESPVDSIRAVAEANDQRAESVRPVAGNGTGDRTVAEDSDQIRRHKPPTSQALAGHLKAIRQILADRQQLGKGNGTLTRSDVEQWQGVSTSQAKNILRYGIEHQLVTVVSRDSTGHVYRFVDN